MATATISEMTPQSPLFVGAGVGVLLAAILGLAGHKAIYGTWVGPNVKPVAAQQDKAMPSAAPVPLVVRANVQTARMSFRGANLPLPYDSTTTSSEMNDYIEVTAPGYEGRRFWIKFDRPRSLVVTLPQGSGIIDATFDETEVALGNQVAKPTQTEAGKAPSNTLTLTRPAAGIPAHARVAPAPQGKPAASAATAAAGPAAPPATAAAAPTGPTKPARPELDKNLWGEGPGGGN